MLKAPPAAADTETPVASSTVVLVPTLVSVREVEHAPCVQAGPLALLALPAVTLSSALVRLREQYLQTLFLPADTASIGHQLAIIEPLAFVTALTREVEQIVAPNKGRAFLCDARSEPAVADGAIRLAMTLVVVRINRDAWPEQADALLVVAGVSVPLEGASVVRIDDLHTVFRVAHTGVFGTTLAVRTVPTIARLLRDRGSAGPGDTDPFTITAGLSVLASRTFRTGDDGDIGDHARADVVPGRFLVIAFGMLDGDISRSCSVAEGVQDNVEDA
jgi:hypothetical protein